MFAPRVSVITRTKDRPLLLRRAIRSVLEQDFSSWEMLIANDGGDRATVEALVAEVADAAAGRIRVLHLVGVGDMQAASNAALEVATGEFVVIHDDDDSWLPTFLTRCVAHLDTADACVAAVVTHSNRVDEHIEDDAVHIDAVSPYSPGLTSVSLMAMARGNMFPPIAFLFKRSLIDELGPFKSEASVLGDWEFNLRVLERYEIEVIQEPLANYHLRPAARSGIYSNTVIGGVSVHQKYDTRLRNAMLRKDLQEGRVGLGFLTNLGRMLNDHLWEMRRGHMMENTLGRLRMQGLTRFAVYGAGELGRQVASGAQASGFTVQHIVDRNQGLWGTPLEGVTVVGLEQALDNGCDTFVIASLTYASEIRASIKKVVAERGVAVRIFEMDQAA